MSIAVSKILLAHDMIKWSHEPDSTHNISGDRHTLHW